MRVIEHRDRTFLAERLEPDGAYGETFEAASWDAAEAICAERGWLLKGRLSYTIYDITPEDADAIISAMNERSEANGVLH